MLSQVSIFVSISLVLAEGHFTHSRKRTRFFRNKRSFDGFFFKAKGSLPKVHEIFGSEMPLGFSRDHKTIKSPFPSACKTNLRESKIQQWLK